MWWCFLLFAACSAFPLDDLSGSNDPRLFLEGFPASRHRLCLPSPFLDHLSLPSALQLFSPLHNLITGRHRCFPLPFARTYIIKVCPKNEGTPTGENFNGTPKEIMKEKEKEKELLPDNANIEVKGEEVETENFVKKQKSVESKESELEDKDMESKNKIIQVSKEIIQVSNANDSPQQPPLDSFEKNFDENVSITSNLV